MVKSRRDNSFARSREWLNAEDTLLGFLNAWVRCRAIVRVGADYIQQMPLETYPRFGKVIGIGLNCLVIGQQLLAELRFSGGQGRVQLTNVVC